MQVCFGGGARPWRPCAWKNKCKVGTVAKAKKLVDLVSDLSPPQVTQTCTKLKEKPN